MSWKPMVIRRRLRRDESALRVFLPRLLLLVGALTAVSAGLAILVGVLDGYELSVRILGQEIHWSFFPPLVVGVLTLLWIGIVPALVVTVASTAVFGVWLGFPSTELWLYALSDVAPLVVLALAFSLTGARIDLRSSDSRITYGLAGVTAVLSSMPGALIWILAMERPWPMAADTLQAWFVGGLVDLFLVVAPALYWLSTPVLEWRARVFGPSPGEDATLSPVPGYGLLLAALAVFVVGADRLIERRLEPLMTVLEPAGARDLVWAAVEVGGYLAYLLLLLSVGVAGSLIYARARTRKSLKQRVTERTEELERAVRQLEHAQRMARSGSWRLDLERDELEWSAGTYDMFGLDPESFGATFEAFFERVHPQDRERVAAAQALAVAGEQELDLQHRIVRPDGQVRWVEERAVLEPGGSGGGDALVGTVLDVTEWRRRELEAAALLERQEALLEHSPAAVVLLDTDARVRMWTPAAERIFGWSSDEVIGQPPPFVAAEQEESFRRNFRLGLRRGSVRDMEVERRRADGSAVWVSLSAARIHDPAGDPIGLLGIMVDITDRVRARHQIVELTERLEERVALRTEELERINEELESFTRTVSHDLRAPARAVAGFGSRLLERYGDALPSEAREDVERIARAGEQMEALITDLLQLARRPSEPPSRRVDVLELLESVRSSLAHEIERYGARVSLPPVGVELLADPVLLRQVFTNLLMNAVRYGRTETAAEVDVELERGPSECRIIVADRGPGIPEADRERVFRPFERLPSIGDRDPVDGSDGTGLGLAIVAKCVRMLDWSIELESRPGGGARFCLRAPM